MYLQAYSLRTCKCFTRYIGYLRHRRRLYKVRTMYGWTSRQCPSEETDDRRRNFDSPACVEPPILIARSFIVWGCLIAQQHIRSVLWSSLPLPPSRCRKYVRYRLWRMDRRPDETEPALDLGERHIPQPSKELSQSVSKNFLEKFSRKE